MVYVFWNGSLKRQDVQYLSRSVDGGRSFEKARPVATITECGAFDAVQQDVTFDGVAGTRTNSYPSVDIANGAPTGVDAPDTIVLAWCDAGQGLNHEQALVQTSRDGGTTWSMPGNGAAAGDRPDFPAVAISPDGQDVYLTYDGFLDPWRQTTADPRRFQGVVRHADGALKGLGHGAPGGVGDARASSANGLTWGFLGDYNSAVATNEYGAAVWNDAATPTTARPSTPTGSSWPTTTRPTTRTWRPTRWRSARSASATPTSMAHVLLTLMPTSRRNGPVPPSRTPTPARRTARRAGRSTAPSAVRATAAVARIAVLERARRSACGPLEERCYAVSYGVDDATKRCPASGR